MTAWHFKIIIGNDAALSPAEPADMLPLQFSAGVVEVRTAGPIIDLGERGCIVGHLFSRDIPSQRITQIGPAQLTRILLSAGRSLLKDYWGGYVAVVLAADGDVKIIRDPSGIMPCYWKHDGNQNSFSNDIASIARSKTGPNIDIHAIAHFLASPQYSESNTALDNLTEILPGETISLSGVSTSRVAYWSPWDYTAPDSHLSFEDAARLVRDEATNCISTWASCFDNIVVGVSGGLDSSIVAAIAAQTATNVRCLTMYSDDADGDERKYAMMLALALNLPITAFRFSLDQIDISKSPLPNRPWPNAPFFWESIVHAHTQLQIDRPIDAIFSGNGGDNIFCSLRSTAPFLDRFIVDGPGTGLKQTLLDLCDLTDTSALIVLKTAWRSYQNLKRPKREKLDRRGMSASIMKMLSHGRVSHPWLDSPEDALPGKAAHIAQLVSAHQSHELYPAGDKGSIRHIAPLLSQPLVEACLGIPSWLWIKGGRDRSVARAAFGAHVPASLIQRTGKGGPGQFVHSIYSRHRETVIAQLRDGFLARSGVLDMQYLEHPHDPTWRGQADAQKLLEFLIAENWCQWWLRRAD